MSGKKFQRFATRHLQKISVAAALLTAASSGWAQQDITKIIVAFPPGGPVDFVARTVSEQLGKELGHTVLIENKPGANGAIAADTLLRSPADGKTLWITSVGAVAINPALYPKLPYQPLTDLVPVSLAVNNVEMLVVNSKSPFSNGRDLVEAARKNPGRPITMASSGTGSVPHLAMELLNESANIQMMHIPYKGAAPAITDVIAGHVDGFFGDIPGLIGHIQAGKLKPIAIAASKRHPRFPEVPTYTELGYPGVDSDNWYGFFAAKGTAPEDVSRLSQALHRALHHPTVKERLEASGAEVAGSAPDELRKVLEADTKKWSAVIKKNNITAN